MMFGSGGEFDDGVRCKGAVARTEKDDGERGAIRDRLEVGEHFAHPAIRVCGRSIPKEASMTPGLPDEDGVVVQIGREVGEVERGGDAVAGDAGDEDLFRARGLGGGAEGFAGFVVGEQRGFSRRDRGR